jgi:(S)-2-hydroxyglutarate dehydrogenase
MSSSHSNQHCDVLIVGGGMVGLCIAHQLLERGISRSITVLDKDPSW